MPHHNSPNQLEQLRGFLLQQLNKDPRFILRDSFEALLDRLTRYTLLSSKGVTLTGYINRGLHGIVLRGTRCGRDCAIKLVALGPNDSETSLAKEVRMHFVFRSRLPQHVPQLFDAYIAEHYGRLVGVLVMDRVGHTLHSELKRRAQDPLYLQAAADEVRQLVSTLAANRLVHGDLHLGNIALSHDGSTPLQLIDFGCSFPGSLPVDAYMVWRASVDPSCSYGAAFNQALVEVGFPGSPFVQEITGGSSRPVWGAASHTAMYGLAADLVRVCHGMAERVVDSDPLPVVTYAI